LEKFYNDISFRISRLITTSYSTSFSIAVSFLKPETRNAIYSIYGFVRFSDEIVDSFHDHDKKSLLTKFENDYYEAIREGISLNPVLNSFQLVVKKYKIEDELIQAFLKSMKADLFKEGNYNHVEINEYIYGSAEVVGLMCLRVFLDGDAALYSELTPPAMKLGSAFQKVNFLRDLKNDVEHLNRSYFPDFDKNSFNDSVKVKIISDIENEFSASFRGIKKLPKDAKLPVLIAYYYYLNLLHKIRNTPAEKLIMTRIRVANYKKFILLIKAYIAVKLNMI
jgi:phytoene/squalene synthetase